MVISFIEHAVQQIDRARPIIYAISTKWQAKTYFLIEWFALDLVKDENGRVGGVSAIEMATGVTLLIVQSKRY